MQSSIVRDGPGTRVNAQNVPIRERKGEKKEKERGERTRERERECCTLDVLGSSLGNKRSYSNVFEIANA